jgi:hypothetical protein
MIPMSDQQNNPVGHDIIAIGHRLMIARLASLPHKLEIKVTSPNLSFSHNQVRVKK